MARFRRGTRERADYDDDCERDGDDDARGIRLGRRVTSARGWTTAVGESGRETTRRWTTDDSRDVSTRGADDDDAHDAGVERVGWWTRRRKNGGKWRVWILRVRRWTSPDDDDFQGGGERTERRRTRADCGERRDERTRTKRKRERDDDDDDGVSDGGERWTRGWTTRKRW